MLHAGRGGMTMRCIVHAMHGPSLLLPVMRGLERTAVRDTWHNLNRACKALRPA